MFVLVRRSVYTLHCRYAPGIGPVHLISVLFFLGFSFPYAEYLCVAGPHKFSSSVRVGISKVRYMFGRAHGTWTRPWCNNPSERRGITFRLTDIQDLHTHWPRGRDPNSPSLGFEPRGRRAH